MNIFINIRLAALKSLHTDRQTWAKLFTAFNFGHAITDMKELNCAYNHPSVPAVDIDL
jgi:hypothetical protein